MLSILLAFTVAELVWSVPAVADWTLALSSPVASSPVLVPLAVKEVLVNEEPVTEVAFTPAAPAVSADNWTHTWLLSAVNAFTVVENTALEVFVVNAAS